MKAKQGVIDESELEVEVEEKREYSFGEKVSNYFYHNKWWLGIAAVVAVVVIFLVYDAVNLVRPDMTVLIVCNNYDLSMRTEAISAEFEKYTPDVNEDGEVYVAVYYMPTKAGEEVNYYDLQTYIANQSKFMGEFQDGDSMVVIADVESTNDNAGLDQLLENLEDKFQSDNINGYKYMLKDSKFGENINLSVIPNDLYVGVRAVQVGASYEKKMQRNYDVAMNALEQLISDWEEE